MNNEAFPNVTKAFARFDRYLVRARREALAAEAPGRPGNELAGSLIRVWAGAKRYRERVLGPAFFEDTKEYNNLPNCILAAGLSPCGDPLDALPWLRELSRTAIKIDISGTISP